MRKGQLKSHCKHGHARTPDSTHKNGTCKECNTNMTREWQDDNRDIANKFSREWRAANPELFKNIRRLSKYNITKEEFDHMLNDQGHTCYICGNIFNDTILPHVDHDHECCPNNKSCGKCIRGLLCRNCNTGIGLLKDDPIILQRAIKYLTKENKQWH
jgi:hypothetical protein